MAEQKGFVCYRKSLQTLVMLPDESAGRVIKAAAEAFLNDLPPSEDLPLHEQIVLSLFLDDIADGKLKYTRICERNRKNAGAGADNGGNEPEPMDASGSQSLPVVSSGNQTPRNESNQNESNRNESEPTRTDTKPGKKKKQFVPPTLEEVKAYVAERNSPVDPVAFWEYFEAGQWKDSEGKPVLAWKQKLLTWEKHQNERRGANGNERDSKHYWDKFYNIHYDA